MAIYIGQGGINHQLKHVYIGNGGVNGKQKEIYVGQSGVNEKIYTGSLFELANVPVNGNTYSFPSGLVGNSIEFSSIVSNITSFGHSSIFNINFSDGAILRTMSYREWEEDGEVFDTYLYYVGMGGDSFIRYIGGANETFYIKITLIDNILRFYVWGNLVGSRTISVNSFNFTTYNAIKSSSVNASYTNLIIK